MSQLAGSYETASRDSFKADKERQELAATPGGRSQTEITVQYFPKDVDGTIVTNALQELDFSVMTAESRFPNVETNAIWFGKNVSIKDLKLLAYTLIRANVGIKAIRPFRNPDEWPDNFIQVGGDAAYISKQPLTVEEIERASKFIRTE